MTPQPVPVATENRPSVSAGITGMFNVFIDPAATANAVKAPLFWLWPLIITSIVSILYGMFFTPLLIDTMRKYPPGGASGPPLDQPLRIAETLSRAGMFASPSILAGFLALVPA